MKLSVFVIISVGVVHVPLKWPDFLITVSCDSLRVLSANHKLLRDTPIFSILYSFTLSEKYFVTIPTRLST